MRIVHTFLAFPALALCATFTGTVVDLSGAPIAGAVVKTLADSATTPGNGTWTLARTLSVARRNANAVSVASHLVVENGRPRLVFGGVDASGHRFASVQNVPSELAAGRTATAVGTDTLKLYWKGKRLVVLPIASADSTGIVLRVDTAWSDDASIPWNPAISYGSVLDVHDGKTYRTVGIGSQWWMAENLNYAGASGSTGVCYNSSAHSCTKYGRLYEWYEVMAGHASSTTSPSGVQGICPTGWHVPSDSEWSTMQKVVDASNTTNGTKLKSTAGWNIYNGTSGNCMDIYGFRALPGGNVYGGSSGNAGDGGSWWSATEYGATDAWLRDMYYSSAYVSRDYEAKTIGFSLRCLKDAP